MAIHNPYKRYDDQLRHNNMEVGWRRREMGWYTVLDDSRTAMAILTSEFSNTMSNAAALLSRNVMPDDW